MMQKENSAFQATPTTTYYQFFFSFFSEYNKPSLHYIVSTRFIYSFKNH